MLEREKFFALCLHCRDGARSEMRGVAGVRAVRRLVAEKLLAEKGGLCAALPTRVDAAAAGFAAPNVRANRTAEVSAGWPRKEDLYQSLEWPDGDCRSRSGG
jgi:hypothetical protein